MDDNQKLAKSRIKFFKGFSLSLSFFAMGICGAILGPTLPTLAYNLQTDVSTLSFILPAKSVGYLFGSIVSGLVNEKLDSHLMLFLSVLVNGIGSFLIPFVTPIVLLAVVNCTVGIASGFLDTAGNVMCLQTWGEKSGPYLQNLHFFFAIGTTIAPLLALPFVKETNSEFLINTDLETTISSFVNYSDSSTVELISFEKFNAIVYAYVCCGAISSLVSLCFLYLFCFHRQPVSNQKDTVKSEGNIFRIKVLSLLFVFFLVYVGMEVTFGVYIYIFAVNCENHYPKSEASALTTIYWGLFAVGRFVAIPVSKILSPFKVLVLDLVGSFIAAVTLACFPFYAKSTEFIFWIAVGLYGFSMASIFPSGISWAEQYITVTGKAAVVMVVGASTGDMILPFIIGQYIETFPMFLMYFGVAAVCASALIFILLNVVASSKGKRLKRKVSCEFKEEKLDLSEESKSLAV